MTFQVEITPIAGATIEQAYRWYRERNPEFADLWFRGLMNTIATLQEKPQRCSLAIEHEIFPDGEAQTGLPNGIAFIASEEPDEKNQKWDIVGFSVHDYQHQRYSIFRNDLWTQYNTALEQRSRNDLF
jgi:plasmid stabilization system protein ParE